MNHESMIVQTTTPVTGDGQPAGTMRRGHVDRRLIHAAACRRCWWARYDAADFNLMVAEFVGHLHEVHEVGTTSAVINGQRIKLDQFALVAA